MSRAGEGLLSQNLPISDLNSKSPGAKRPRFAPASIASTNDDHSVPSTPMVNGRVSLSPTNSMLSLGTMEEQPTITVAMLRALTRDMKRKYVGS